MKGIFSTHLYLFIYFTPKWERISGTHKLTEAHVASGPAPETGELRVSGRTCGELRRALAHSTSRACSHMSPARLVPPLHSLAGLRLDVYPGRGDGGQQGRV